MTHDPPAQKHSPRWQGLTHTGKTNDAGIPIPGDPIIINCHNHLGDDVRTGICDPCAADLRSVLADIPQILDDLDIAIAGQARFVEHGIRTNGSEPTGGGHPAIAAQNRLTLALLGDGTQAHPGVSDWFNNYGPASYARQLTSKLLELQLEPRMPNLARDLTQAASRAHKVIDSPPELWYYGPCPNCERDLWQERIHHEDTKTPIVCRYPTCDYAAPLDVHNRRALEVGHDRQMTLDELVGAITSGGITVTREQIKGWIYRDGLPRLRRNRPRYVDGELHQNEVWTYRLGDVLDYALRAAAKRHRISS